MWFYGSGTKADSSVLHCASLLRTMLASLAQANDRVHLQNEINFPQAKLDSEVHSRFLLTRMVTCILYCSIIAHMLSSLIQRYFKNIYVWIYENEAKGLKSLTKRASFFFSP